MAKGRSSLVSSQFPFPPPEELDAIRRQARTATSDSSLRECFERLKALRRSHADDFDTNVLIAELQHEIVDRARMLRERGPLPAEQPTAFRRVDAAAPEATPPDPDAAEFSPDVERLDAKNWQRAIYIGLFFAVLLFAAFFYLIQTARRLNLTPSESAQAAPANQQAAGKPVGVQNTADASQAAAKEKPAVRLYTDLVPGSVIIDTQPPQELKDGELTLDNLESGHHTIRVTGSSGNAEFSFNVDDDKKPSIAGLPTASNVMAVLVETHDGQARLVTNAHDSVISLDGAPAGDADPEGLTVSSLGKTDHLLQVTEGRDRQRFVLTYTAAPTLTAYVKSDPNAGTVVVVTKVDNADVYINDKLYRRQTAAGQLRIPLTAGDYTIRVHKAGYIDPPPGTVEVKKAEETAVNFRMEAVPQIATLQVKGSLPGTMIYIDHDFAATSAADGSATIPNVKPGAHTVELRRDQALPKRFEHTFKNGDTVLLSGPDVLLDRAVVDASTSAPPPIQATQPVSTADPTKLGMQMDGEQVRKGGGFVTYHVPHVGGHYTFAGQARLGGLLKRGKLQWYAGYQDSQNYVLFTVDGKHATARTVQDGKVTEVNRIPFDADSNTWVQVDLAVNPNSITARVKTPASGWSDLGTVPSAGGRDYTQGRVGFYIPEKDEIAVSNFRFSAR